MRDVIQLGSIVIKALSTLFILPLEMHRLKSKQQLLEERIGAEVRFLDYHTGGHTELVEWQVKPLREQCAILRGEWARLNEIKPSGEAETLLRATILAMTELNSNVERLSVLLAEDDAKGAQGVIGLLQAMLRRLVLDSQSPPIFLHFNNFLTPYLQAVQALVSETRRSIAKPRDDSISRAIFGMRALNASNL